MEMTDLFKPVSGLSVWGKDKKNYKEREKGRACALSFGTNVLRHPLCIRYLHAPID